MKMSAILFTAFGCTLVACGSAVGQSSPLLDISVRGGVLLPTNELGAVAATGTAWHLDLKKAEWTPTLEISARAAWPGRRLGTRLTGSYALPTDASGFFNCNPGLACPAVLLPSDAEVGILSIVGDLLIAPFDQKGRVQPWLAIGAGVRRYNYSWPDAEVLVGSGARTETSLALHGGLGFTLDLPIGSLEAEVADYWIPESDDIVPPASSSAGSGPRRKAQHDLVLNIGWRLLRL